MVLFWQSNPNPEYKESILQPYLQCSSPRHRKIYWSPKLPPAQMQLTERTEKWSLDDKNVLSHCDSAFGHSSCLNYLCQRAEGPNTPVSCNIRNKSMKMISVVDSCYLVSTNRVDKSCDGLENQPEGIHLQGVLVGPLDAVKDLLLLTVHCGILQSNSDA